jgi:hypothetical protein
MLKALIAFLPTEENGIGALTFSSEVKNIH